MKNKANRNDVPNRDEIWNTVLATLTTAEDLEGNPTLRESSILFYYYAELESGGHEAWLNWLSEDIAHAGIDNYLNELTDILKKIGADSYAEILYRYGKDMWELHLALENSGKGEERFYEIIHKADAAYYNLDDKLQVLIEDFFVENRSKLIGEN
ncbi:DMP19 family protein [Bacillus sp. EB01]|uniref:DMP19 family protein n=1 Tax=Bacillus sp. EB01 TaxID=1347086 RepID=UPI0005C4D8C3|nr:hypothetical protein [Bacillus sp. EB01]